MNNENKSDIIGNFSVALGLFDYINPIMYGITVITVMFSLYGKMKSALFVIFAIGAVISLCFGLTIPTVKLIVGLGKMQFKMPVNLVSYVNTGILISGIPLFMYAVGIKPLTLVLILIVCAALIGLSWYKTGRFNTAAVLIGTVGYILIYVSLILLSVQKGKTVSVVLLGIAICLFVFLCFVGIFANLKNSKVHWVIEISNVICQSSVALSTVILFLA